MSSNLYTVALNQIALPQDLNQLVNVLAQPPSGQEAGQYWLAWAAYGNASIGSQFMTSVSRNNAPVSVTIDESLNAHSAGNGHCNAVQVSGSYYYGGVQVFAFSDNLGAHPSCNVAGNLTFHY